jgi:hypothetical protein
MFCNIKWLNQKRMYQKNTGNVGFDWLMNHIPDEENPNKLKYDNRSCADENVLLCICIPE